MSDNQQAYPQSADMTQNPVSNPPIPPRAPLQPLGFAELPGFSSPQMTPTGGLPTSASNTQPTSPTQTGYQDSVLSSDRQSRVTSGQFGPAPSYMETNPHAYPYGYPGNSSQYPYGTDPKMGGVAVGGYVPPVQQPIDAQPTGGHTNICGLRRSTFWLVLTIALLIIIGAVLGGVLGGVVFKNNNDNPSPNSSQTPAPSTTRRTATSSSYTPITTTSSTTSSSTTWLFTIPTGTWILNGERILQQGTCVADNSTENSNSVALWKCPQYQNYQVQVDADSNYGYVLSGDQPTRFRALTPTPPSSGARYWAFSLRYQQIPTAVPVQGNCVMDVVMIFSLGEDISKPKDGYFWVEATEPKSECVQKNGLKTSASVICTCGWSPVGFVKRDLPMSPQIHW